MRHLLGDMDPETFLRDFWQKRPLLIRQGIPKFQSPLDRDELAGMALEEDVESRLIREVDGKFALEHGPFSEKTLVSLPDTHWTLLVQDVDKFLPEVAEFRSLVQFLPAWRMDDIMISYAADQGSVGPHIDLYDVFLLQAEGKRCWKIDASPTPKREHDPDQQLKVLRDFASTDEWTLEPGDILYLPPGVPHHGVAEGPCMTWSFGFRAPTYRDLSESIGDIAAENWAAEDLYTDSDILPAKNSGEISRDTIQTIRERLLAGWRNADWDSILGCILTGHKPNCAPLAPSAEDRIASEELTAALLSSCTLVRDPATRIAYVPDGEVSAVFANGETIAKNLPTHIAQQLCSMPLVAKLALDPADVPMWQPPLSRMINLGLITLD